MQLNIDIYQVQPLLRQIPQSLITNIILHKSLYGTVQRGWIIQTLLILCGVNTKIVTGVLYPDPLIYLYPKFTHTLEELILYHNIISEPLNDKGSLIQHKWQKMVGLYFPLHLLHIFCFCFSHICAFTCFSWTILVLFIWISTVILNGTTLIFPLNLKNVHINQPQPPLNQFMMFAW